MPDFKYSGTPDTFATGAQRDASAGKPRPDLVSPFFMLRVGKRLGQGAEAHGARNWENGIGMQRTYESLQRHLQQWVAGQNDEDHLAAVGCNLVFLIHYEEMHKRGLLPKELNDMPNYNADPEDRGE